MTANKTVEQSLKENINLIRKIAWSFHMSSGLDRDDLFQEAVIAYIYALQTYKPDKGKISTYVWNCISNTLNSYLEREMRVYPAQGDLEEAQHEVQLSFPFWEKIPESISKEVELILENAENISIPVKLRNKSTGKIVYVRPELKLRSFLLSVNCPPDKTRQIIRYLKFAFAY